MRAPQAFTISKCPESRWRAQTQAIFALLLSFVLGACQSNNPYATANLRRSPNIVFILTHDQRFDALGCAGNSIIQTPNIDRLAAEGVRFRNHFVTTSICCVSRASIFSAQYGRRHGIGDFKTPFTREQWNIYRQVWCGRCGIYQVPSRRF